MPTPLRSVSTEDRLLDLLERQTEATDRLGDRLVAELREVRTDIRSTGDQTARLAGEVAELRAIPRLVTLLAVGMFACVALVGIAASAHVAIDAGWVQLGTSP